MPQPLIKSWMRLVASPCFSLLGVFAPQELVLPNAHFDRDLSDWTVTAPSGSVQHGFAPGTREGCAVVRVGGGETASLEMEFEIGAAGDIIDWLPAAGQPGERPRFGARVMVADSSNAGSLVVEIEAVGARAARVLARSEHPVRRIRPDRWMWLDAAPLDSGRLKAGRARRIQRREARRLQPG